MPKSINWQDVVATAISEEHLAGHYKNISYQDAHNAVFLFLEQLKAEVELGRIVRLPFGYVALTWRAARPYKVPGTEEVYVRRSKPRIRILTADQLNAWLARRQDEFNSIAND